MCLRVNLLLVTEGNRFERQECFAGFVHRLDLLLEALGGSHRAEPCRLNLRRRQLHWTDVAPNIWPM